MKEVATENFQRICEAYEILSDETKRLIYDLYGMEGLISGLELGPRLSKADEIKEELERIKRRNEEAKKMAHFLPSGSILFNLSLPHFLDGDGLMRGYLLFWSFQVLDMGVVEKRYWFFDALSCLLCFHLQLPEWLWLVKCSLSYQKTMLLPLAEIWRLMKSLGVELLLQF